MRNWLKKYAGLIYIFIATVGVALVLLYSDELPVILDTLGRLDVRFIWASALCVCLYLLARAVTLLYYLRSQGCKIRVRDALLVMGVGQFYSAITPSSSGGQPMQVLTMHNRGVPVSMATAAVSVKFLGFELAFLLMGGVLWATNARMIAKQLYGVRWLVVVGFLVNLLLVLAVMLTVKKSRVLDRILGFFVRLGVRLHLLKSEEQSLKKAHAMLLEYRTALLTLLNRKFDALMVLLLSICQIFFLMSVICCLYHAFRLTGTSDIELLTLQLLLFITASFVPLPGAAGAQEGGFYLFFRGVIPDANLLAVMVCWRFFTYYLLMIVGLVAVVSENIGNMLRRRRRRS